MVFFSFFWKAKLTSPYILELKGSCYKLTYYVKRELDEVKMPQTWGYFQHRQNRIDSSICEYEWSVPFGKLKILGFEEG